MTSRPLMPRCEPVLMRIWRLGSDNRVLSLGLFPAAEDGVLTWRARCRTKLKNGQEVLGGRGGFVIKMGAWIGISLIKPQPDINSGFMWILI